MGLTPAEPTRGTGTGWHRLRHPRWRRRRRHIIWLGLSQEGEDILMNARTIAVMAVCIAIVAVLVAVVPVPIPATGGFTHPGAVAELFVAMAFGPVVGGVAAGLGAAIADLVLGYGSFAPLTLIAHGSLGVLAGWLGWKKGWGGMIVGWVVGGLALVAVYFIGEATLYGFLAARPAPPGGGGGGGAGRGAGARGAAVGFPGGGGGAPPPPPPPPPPDLTMRSA